MPDEQSEKRRIDWTSVAIALAYIVAGGINVYIILDQITDGASSREISLWMKRTAGKYRNTVHMEKEFQQSAPYVVWEAINIVEGRNAS